MSTNPNFIFFGTPDVASVTLGILKAAGYVPSLIVTAPDRPAGRKMLLTPPPAKTWALENNVPFIQPEKLVVEDFRTYDADFFLVAAYGKIMPEALLLMPRLGSVNIHYSLLPRYRGASPVEAAVLAGDTETGVSIQEMRFKLDSGPILAVEKTAIAPDESAPALRARLIKIGGDLFVKILPDFLAQKITPVAQDESQVTVCGKIKKEDGELDLASDARKNYNKFRAYAAWPRTFFFKDGKRIIITHATLEDGKFVIKKIIPEGGKETDYRE